MHDWLCVGLYYSQRDERERNAYDTETKSSSELCRGGGTAAVRLPQRQQQFRQQEQIARHRPNDKVKLSVKRDGDVKQIDVTLRNKAGKTELITKEDVDVVEALGGKFADAGTKLCRELDIRGGVQVVGVKQGGILSRARVKQGFVITHINDAPVYSLSDMERMTEKIRSIDGIYPNGRSASYMLVE